MEMGTELFGRMLRAGLEPEPRPLAEIGLHMGESTVTPRRWARFARSMLPKIVEYGWPPRLSFVSTRLNSACATS